MSTLLILPINLSKICRVCLIESEELHSIFSVLKNEKSDEEDLIYIYEILMNISSIKILKEDMPNMLCTACLELANTSYKFQQQCNRSQVILETYFTQARTNKCSSLFCNNGKQEILNVEAIDSLVNSKNIESVDEYTKINANDEREIEDSDVDLCEFEVGEMKINAVSISDIQNIKIRQTPFKKTQNKYIIKNLCVSQRKKLYSCTLCNKTYKFGSSLKDHMRSHSLERPYICSLCGKDFKQYASLTYHLRSHSDEQPYKCKICGKKYKQSGSLTTHMRVHTGQRPFLCSVCGRGFRQAPDLKYHMRTHTKEKPYMCNICGKTMSMQCHLVQHMRSHTGERPFKCNECDKAFPSSTRLKRHAIIHTDLKPYKCEVCDKSFNRQSTLRVHAKIHTDERPHVCSICGKGFIQSHSLKSHITTHYTSANEDKS